MISRYQPRFTRTVDLYGQEGFAAVRRGGALVIGLGGVGAHCAVALARTGIGRLKLLDHDRITASSLNRHPIAGPTDVGRLKTEILAAWLGATCPDTHVEAVVARVDAQNVGDLVATAERELFPVLIDCIDDVAGKTALLAHGVAHGWLVASSMGAAGKRDGGLVRAGDLFATRTCPLAKAVRRNLRRQGVGPGKIAAVWSDEAPVPPADPHGERRQPSNQMLPGIFGFALAALAADMLAGPAVAATDPTAPRASLPPTAPPGS